MPSLPHGHERVLRDLLGLEPVSGHERQHPEHTIAFELEELLEDISAGSDRSCSESDLTALAEASLGYVLVLHGDYAALSEHIKSVVEESDQVQKNGVPT